MINLNIPFKEEAFMAIAGFVIALVGVVFGFISFGVPVMGLIGLPVAIVGLVLSCVARKKQASGLATAGMVIGIVATVFTAITFFACGICVLAAAGAGLLG